MTRALAWACALRGERPGHEPAGLERDAGRRVGLAAGAVLHGVEQLDLDSGPGHDRRPLHAEQGGAHEHVEGHLGGDRVSGQPEDELVSPPPEDEGRARLDRDLGEEEPHVELGEDLLHEVVRSLGDAAGDHEYVVAEAVPNRVRDAFGDVRHHPQRPRFRPRPPRLGHHRVPIAVADPPAAGRFPHVDELVPRDEHREGRAPAHSQAPLAGRGQHRHRGGIDRAAALQQPVTRPHLGALPRDVGARLDRREHLHPPAPLHRTRLLHRLHGGRSRRHRGSGHDLDRLSRLERAVGPVAGADLTHHVEDDGRAGDVGRPHRIAVHRRAVEGGHVEVRVDILGEDAADGAREVDLLGGQHRGMAQNDLQCLVDENHRSVPHNHSIGTRKEQEDGAGST